MEWRDQWEKNNFFRTRPTSFISKLRLVTSFCNAGQVFQFFELLFLSQSEVSRYIKGRKKTLWEENKGTEMFFEPSSWISRSLLSFHILWKKNPAAFDNNASSSSFECTFDFKQAEIYKEKKPYIEKGDQLGENIKEKPLFTDKDFFLSSVLQDLQMCVIITIRAGCCWSACYTTPSSGKICERF